MLRVDSHNGTVRLALVESMMNYMPIVHPIPTRVSLVPYAFLYIAILSTFRAYVRALRARCALT